MKESKKALFFVHSDIRAGIEKRLESFDKGYRQNVGLIGSVGLGKSAILFSLFRSLQYQRRFLPVYVNAQVLDFDHFMDTWMGALLSSVLLTRDLEIPRDLLSIQAAASAHVPKTVEKMQALAKTIRREKTGGHLKELLALPAVLAFETGQKVVLMIDEFQELEKLPSSDPFSVFGRQITVEKNVFYIAASSRPERARAIFRDKLTLLFGNFEVFEMEPFDFKEAFLFLENRLPHLQFSEPQARFLIRMTDGHAMHLEHLADSLEEFYSRRGYREFLGVEVRIPVEQEILMMVLHRNLSPGRGRMALAFERKMESLARLAKDSSPYARVLLALSESKRKLPAISASVERKTVETQKILQRLIQEDFVIRQGSFFTLQDPLFRFWLRYVYRASRSIYTPDTLIWEKLLDESLCREFERSEAEESRDLASRVETLFKQFRNDAVYLARNKKIVLPQFSEVISRTAQDRWVLILARNSKVLWACQAAGQKVQEEDVAAFLDEIKRHRKKISCKIMITLQGIEQNARLIAQEANIQLLSLRDFNSLLDLYDLPKMITLSLESPLQNGGADAKLELGAAQGLLISEP